MVDNKWIEHVVAFNSNERIRPYAWFYEKDNLDYIYFKSLEMSQQSHQDLMQAAEDCYALFEKGLKKIIDENLWNELHIPKRAIPLIEYSFKQRHPFFLGRFDFAGGFGDPIKLIEFNADTPTLLVETGLLQNEIQDTHQLKPADDILDKIKDHLLEILDDPDWHKSLLFSSLGYIEDKLTAKLMKEKMSKANILSAYEDLPKLIFTPDEGVFLEHAPESFHSYRYLIKWIPWDFILFEEPELYDLLDQLIVSKDLKVLNPAYSLVYSSKAFLAFLYKTFPNHPLLLPTSLKKKDFKGKKHVLKPDFGRLGENIKIKDENGDTLEKTKGDYGDFPKVAQAFHPLAKKDDIYIQPSVFYGNKAYGVCARGQDDLIIDDDCWFIPLVIKN